MKRLALLALVPTLLFAQAGSGQPVPVGSGGTGATNQSAARINLGLGNVNNTSDANKPVSIATQAALDLKESSAGAQAKADAAQAAAIQRANHTGTQAISTVTGLQPALDAKLPITRTLSNLSTITSVSTLSPVHGGTYIGSLPTNPTITLPTPTAGDWFVLKDVTVGTAGTATFSSGIYRAGQSASTITTLGTVVGKQTYAFSADGTAWTLTDSQPGQVALATDVTGILPSANGGAGTVNGILKANGSGTTSAAVVGTDYLAPGGALGTPSSGTGTNITGIPAANISAGALANGMTATTQSPGDNSTKIASTAYVEAAVAAGGGGGGLTVGSLIGWPTASIGSLPTNYLVADGTNGTTNAGTFGTAGAGTWIQLGNGTVATPSASPAGGTYGSTQSVTLSSATSGASIYYTTNGATPTTSDTLYSTAVSVATTTTLKAKAFKSLYSPSAVMTETYTIGGGYIYENELVYANSGAATSDGWTGTGNFVYTTTTIAGFAKSVRMTWGDESYRTFTATGNVSTCIKIKVVSIGNASIAFTITDGTNNLAKVKFLTGGVVRFGYGPNDSGSFDSTYSTATDYWLWVDRVKSTGVVSYYLSSSGTKPGSATATVSTGFTTQDATRVYLMSSDNAEYVFNDLFIKDSPIGSNP